MYRVSTDVKRKPRAGLCESDYGKHSFSLVQQKTGNAVSGSQKHYKQVFPLKQNVACSKTTRYNNLRRKIRRAIADAAGKEKNDRRGTGGKKRSAKNFYLQLGIGDSFSIYRKSPADRKSVKNESQKSLTKRVIFTKTFPDRGISLLTVPLLRNKILHVKMSVRNGVFFPNKAVHSVHTFILTENKIEWTALFLRKNAMNLVKTAAQIENSSAKGIYFAINVGVNSRKELLYLFNRPTLDRGVKYLIEKKLILYQHDTKMYLTSQMKPDSPDGILHHYDAKMYHRDANAAAIKSKLINQSINQSLEIEKDENEESESFIPLQKYSFEEALNAFENLPKEIRPVQEVRRKLFTPTVPQKCIDSTDDIPDLINRLTKDQIDVLDTRRKIVRDFFYEKGISPELIDRIALMPLTLGINIEVSDCLDIYPEWKKQVEDYKKDTGLKGYAKLYEIVRWTYEYFGVEFNSCKNPSEYTALLTLKKFVSRRYSRMKQQAQSETGLLFE